MPPQTKRQREVLDIITRFIKNRGFKPSYQQIARELGVRSKGGVAKHIKALEQHGDIVRKRENGSFVLELRSEMSQNDYICQIKWLSVPKDLELAEGWEFEPLFVPRLMLGNSDEEQIRAYRVSDDAMIDEHILEGDIVLIESRSYARDGDTVVAVIENNFAVCQKYYRLGSKIEFQSANPYFPPIEMPADKVEIKGVVHCVLRPAN